MLIWKYAFDTTIRSLLYGLCLACFFACESEDVSSDVVCIDCDGAPDVSCSSDECTPDVGWMCRQDEDCDDGNACTTGARCQADGACAAPEPVDIPSDACQTCTCDSDTGVECVPVPLPDDPCQSCTCDPETGVVCTPRADDDPTNPCARSHCEVLGLPERVFSDGPFGTDYGSLVSDFVVNTLDGPWRFAEEWTGCDTYLFFNYHPDYEYPVAVWNSSVEAWLESSPPNVHYFFGSYNPSTQMQDVMTLQARIDAALADREDADAWRARIHYVTDPPQAIPVVGQAQAGRGAWAIGIDRFQRFQEIGYLATPDNRGEWQASLRSLTFEARYYDHEVLKAAAIDALDSTPIDAFGGEFMGGGRAFIDLPNEEEMDAYDTLHLELSLACGDPFTENCGEWDYKTHLYLCAQPMDANTQSDTVCQPHVPAVRGMCFANGEATERACDRAEQCADESETRWTCEGAIPAVPADTLPCTCQSPVGGSVEAVQSCNGDGTGYNDCGCPCDTELGRWITAYARGGRWLTDASPLLALFPQGGTQQIRYQSRNRYHTRLTFHLSSSGVEAGRPQTVVPLYSGSRFNADYNTRYEPMDVPIPADATRVVLYATITGHGWGAEVANCAEFCNHTHHFTVNGTEYVKEHPMAQRTEGCIEQIEQGTVPNQFGTWPYGRAGWCPGKQVDPWIVDVTESITPGSTAEIDYEGLFRGADYMPMPSGSGQGFGANITMNSHLVIYRE